jgi:hypothetical protein
VGPSFQGQRRVDEAFLNDMPRFIGPRGMTALERINAALDLDYGGIDFAVNADGDVLLFEANVVLLKIKNLHYFRQDCTCDGPGIATVALRSATMVMVPLSNDKKWDYRRPAFDAVFAAVRAILMQRARHRGRQSGGPSSRHCARLPSSDADQRDVLPRAAVCAHPRPFSPRLITAVVLFYPVGVACYWRASHLPNPSA